MPSLIIVSFALHIRRHAAWLKALGFSVAIIIFFLFLPYPNSHPIVITVSSHTTCGAGTLTDVLTLPDSNLPVTLLRLQPHFR